MWLSKKEWKKLEERLSALELNAQEQKKKEDFNRHLTDYRESLGLKNSN